MLFGDHSCYIATPQISSHSQFSMTLVFELIQQLYYFLLLIPKMVKKIFYQNLQKMRWPGIEPGSTAWKATMLTITPPTPLSCTYK